MKAELHEGPIESILPAWKAVFDADPLATPYVSPEWARAWWPHWGASARPWIITIHDGNQIVGLAPLLIRRQVNLRMLRVIGKEPGDYWDILAHPSARDAVANAVARELARRQREWDALVLNCLPAGTVTDQACERAGLRILRRPANRCPGIDLPATFEEYLAALPGSHRRNLRRHLQRLERSEVELREVHEPAQLRTAIERWHEIRLRQWDQMGKRIIPEHRTVRFREFMRDLVLLLVPAGMAIVHELRRAGEVVGVFVNFLDEHRFYWYLGGFEPGAAWLGLGKIVIGATIRSSIAAGRRYYDFTMGAEPYKYWYGARDQVAPSLVLGGSRPSSRAALVAARVASHVRARNQQFTV